MKWTKPKLHDLSNLKESVAQGACADGGSYSAACDVGNIAGSCTFGDAVDNGGGGTCSGGSAVS
jgi:hypothetical protein